MTLDAPRRAWRAPRRDRRLASAPRWWPWALLGVLLLGGGALLAYYSRGTTFWADEWIWITQRRGSSIGTFLDPHNEHLSLVPIVIYKLLFVTVGLRHYWPYRGVVIGAQLVVVGLVFVYARSRIGAWLALLAAALLLFFGPGWQDILWPFQVAWLVAIGAGVGALLLLDRGDRRGDLGACALLAVSLASAGPGLAVALGVVVEVVLRRARRQWWIFAVPIALYVLWWLSYQQSHLSPHAITLLPRFVFNAAAGVVSSLAGLSGLDVATSTGDFLSWGPPLLALAVIVIVWRLRRLERVPARVWTLLAMLVGFWVATGIGRAYVGVGSIALTGTGFESRYLYIGAVLALLLAAELARGLRAGRGATVTITILTAAAIVSNLGVLSAAGDLLRGTAQFTRAELGTLDLERTRVSPGFRSGGFIFALLQAGPYFAAERALGTPAAPPAEIAGDLDVVRAAADAQLIQILHPTLQPAARIAFASSGPPKVDGAQSGSVTARGPCVTFRSATFAPVLGPASLQLTLPAGGLLLSAQGAPVPVGLRRFSTQFQQLGSLSPAAPALLRIPSDSAPQPWHVRLSPTAAVTACVA